MHNLVSCIGIFVFMGIAWCLSSDRKRMNWRLIGWGLGLQFLFAMFIFHVPAGIKLFRLANVWVVKLLDAARAGSEFMFGPLATGKVGFIFAFEALPTVIFFSALMSILYYLRIMPAIIRGFSFVFTKLLGISGAEALCAASNIFVGIESALTIRPHLKKMTPSEFCTILTVGMATVASSVLAVYVMFLEKSFPSIAGHLISASFLSAPAALIMSKIMVPETGKPDTLGITVHPHYDRESSFFEAVISGANSGVKLVVGIGALLLAVLGLIALVNIFLNGIGWRLNGLLGTSIDWSIQGLLAYFFYPFTLMLGVESSEAFAISKLIGVRAIATEIPAYQMLAGCIADGVIGARGTVICTYVLCGFAHITSMAIFVGGTCALVPERTADITRAGIKALIAATLACFMTACVAGTVYSASIESVLLGK